MAPSSFMFLALNFLLLFLTATQDSSGAIPIKTALDELCETLGRSYHVTPEQCISALCYDPSLPCSAAHNASALAALATKLIVANATIARDSIKAALSSFVSTHNSTVEDEEIAAAMFSCLDLYLGIIPSLQWVSRSVIAGQYHGAREVLNATFFIPNGCEGMVESAGLYQDVIQVLPKENRGFSTMAYVTRAIIAAMSRVH